MLSTGQIPVQAERGGKGTSVAICGIYDEKGGGGGTKKKTVFCG